MPRKGTVHIFGEADWLEQDTKVREIETLYRMSSSPVVWCLQPDEREKGDKEGTRKNEKLRENPDKKLEKTKDAPLRQHPRTPPFAHACFPPILRVPPLPFYLPCLCRPAGTLPIFPVAPEDHA